MENTHDPVQVKVRGTLLTPLSPSALLTRKEEFSKSGFGARPEAQAAGIPGCPASAPLSEEPTSDTWVSELGETKSALQLPEVLGLRGRPPPPRGRIGPTNRRPERGGGGARAWRGGAGRDCGEAAGLRRPRPVARRARGWRAGRAEGLGRAPRDLAGPWVRGSVACPGTGLAAPRRGRRCPAGSPPGPRGRRGR